jgi:putative FmdB family regulatory protein
MPTYDYVCEKCGRKWEDFVAVSMRDSVVCKCGEKATKLISSGVSIIPPFQEMVYHDICETPILIKSKQHLRDECKKHNVIAARLL